MSPRSFNPRNFSRRRFWTDLTRTRHMTAVSAVVLGTTFMPLLGVPDIAELRAFQGAVEGFSEARAGVLAPRRDDEAARERSARSVIGERERSVGGDARADRVLTVERPARQALDMDNAVPLDPLAVEGTDLMAPIADEELAPVAEEEEVVPEIAEEKPEAPPEFEDEPMLEEEPLMEEEEEF